jgi:hypothetical protein
MKSQSHDVTVIRTARSLARLYAAAENLLPIGNKPKNKAQCREPARSGGRLRVRYFRGFGPEPVGRPPSLPSDLIALDSATEIDFRARRIF